MMKDKQYDLTLGNFGPYNKEYLGVCHIADKKRGATLNVEMFPGFFRRSVTAPTTKSDNGVKMWGANPDLTRFCYRYELQWKDEIYCDVDYNITDDRQVDITCTFVNNTDFNQSLDMALSASLQLPVNKPASEVLGFLDFYRPVLPKDCICIDATEYSDICSRNEIATDGMNIGEDIFNGASGRGSLIFWYYFYAEDHFVKYDFEPIYADSVGLRCNALEDTELIVKTATHSYRVPLKGREDLEYVWLNIEPEELSSITVCTTGVSTNLDSVCIGKNCDKVFYEKIPHNLEAEKVIEGNRMTLTYKDIPYTYNIVWHEPIRAQRRCYCYDIGKLLSLTVNDHGHYTMHGSGEGVHEVVYAQPVYLKPHESFVRHYTVYIGDAPIEKKEHDLYTIDTNPEGQKYLFSQNMMGYNTLLNVVYPIYTRKQYIKHNTPGRFWDSLYSWDSGFIGMGLAAADFRRGFECLNTYLVPVGDRHCPYIFHGSVVPTQVFLYKHLIDNFPQHRDELASLYPMMRQYFDFYANMDKLKDQLNSGLLKTWGMSYNSGGWDDYPPQDDLANHVTGRSEYGHFNVTPVITTANTVLISKIMSLIAPLMGHGEDVEYYNSVVKKYTDVIHCYDLWDEEVGYFSYMVHGEDGMPKEKFRYTDGSNYNKGMDGVTPYIAGICTPHQEELIYDNIKNGLMTDIGVGVVDKRASYYSNYGYWNGSVWMPHQWILWKALIDRGETDLAFEIAEKSLAVWAKEVETSYCCFENFMCHNGRGSGYHQFSGLSCPISLFFAGYYTPGTVTPGFASSVEAMTWDADNTALDLGVTALDKDVSILVCMNAAKEYTFTVNGKEITPTKLTDGAYSVKLDKGNNKVVIY